MKWNPATAAQIRSLESVQHSLTPFSRTEDKQPIKTEYGLLVCTGVKLKVEENACLVIDRNVHIV